MHDIADMLQLGAELSARMQHLKVAGGKAAALEERDRQRVPEDELHRRRRGRREAVRAGLVRIRQGEANVRLAAERALRRGRHADQRDGVALGEGDDRGEFDRLAGPGEGEQDVAVLDHPEVAVAGFGGMDKGGRLAGGGERRGDLPGDVPGFAHAGDDDAAGRRRDCLHRTREGGAQSAVSGRPHRLVERVEPAPFGVEGSQRRQGGARLFVKSCGSLPPPKVRQNWAAAGRDWVDDHGTGMRDKGVERAVTSCTLS